MAFTLMNDDGGPVSAKPVRGRMVILSDMATPGNSKTLTLAGLPGTRLRIFNIRAELATSATVGTRRMLVQVTSPAADITRVLEFDKTETASSTSNYEAAIGYSPTSAPVDINREVLPDYFFLLAGESLKVFDVANIAPGSDTLMVHILGELS